MEATPKQYSETIPGLVLRNHFWQAYGSHKDASDQTQVSHAKQVPYQLYYLSGPIEYFDPQIFPFGITMPRVQISSGYFRSEMSTLPPYHSPSVLAIPYSTLYSISPWVPFEEKKA